MDGLNNLRDKFNEVSESLKGRSIKKGSKIIIYKSKGKETIKLDDYTGENSVKIKTLLETKFNNIIQKCLDKNPQNRYSSFKELRNDLENANWNGDWCQNSVYWNEFIKKQIK